MASDKGGAAVVAGDRVTIEATVVAVNPGGDGQNLTLETAERTPVDGNVSRLSVHAHQVRRVGPVNASVVLGSTAVPEGQVEKDAIAKATAARAEGAGGHASGGDPLAKEPPVDTGDHRATDIGDSTGPTPHVESSAEAKRISDASAELATGHEPKDTRTAAEKKADKKAAKE